MLRLMGPASSLLLAADLTQPLPVLLCQQDMRHRQKYGRLLSGMFLLLLLTRPALACLTVAPSTPVATHDCCKKSCQHQQMQKEMERCCQQQHNSTTRPLALSLGKDRIAALDGAAMLTHATVVVPQAPARTTHLTSQPDLGRIHAPPPLYVLHRSLLI